MAAARLRSAGVSHAGTPHDKQKAMHLMDPSGNGTWSLHADDDDDVDDDDDDDDGDVGKVSR